MVSLAIDPWSRVRLLWAVEQWRATFDPAVKFAMAVGEGQGRVTSMPNRGNVHPGGIKIESCLVRKPERAATNSVKVLVDENKSHGRVRLDNL